MVFNQKRSRNRRSSNQRTPPATNIQNSVDLMELIRSRPRYHPYVFDGNVTPMTSSRRSQHSLRNTRHDMNEFYRSVYGEISPHAAVSYNDGREDMATNTSLTSFPALAQPQDLPTTSVATHSGSVEKNKDLDEKKIDEVKKDKNLASSSPEVPQPSFLSPVSQTSSKSSSNEVTTTDESPSSASFIEEEGSMVLESNIKPNADSAESSSDIEKTFLPSIFADLTHAEHSSENSAASESTIDVVPEEDLEEENSQTAADEEAGGDGEHNNNSVIEIEITVTTTNDTNSDEDEYEGGDEES